MALQDTFTLRFGDEHTAALQRLARLYRRSRADTLRLLVEDAAEREAARLALMPDRAGLTVIDRPEVLA